ncbi:MAG: class I SAM-dependent methyltransferase [Acidobacteriota bacterium]
MAEIDLSEVVKEIRDEAERRRREDPEFAAAAAELRETTREGALSSAGLDQLGSELANLAVSAGKIAPGTRFAGLKRFILRLIQPFTIPQMQFNRAVTQALSDVVREQAKIVDLIDDFNRFLFEKDREAALREFASKPSFHAVSTPYPYSARATEAPEAGLPFDYLRFQDRVRGPREQIRASMLKYVQYFEHSEPVVDLGCGRGEFLELLRDAGVDSRGVDADRRMVTECRDKGLDVVEGDLMPYLESLEPESLGGVVLTQVVEHLDLSSCLRLITLARSRLKSGGVLLVETPNPGSLFTHACGLFLDPTHVRPYHPIFLEFLFKELGLGSVEVIFSSPPEESWLLPRINGPSFESLNEAFDGLNRLVFGSQDYAVVGRK